MNPEDYQRLAEHLAELDPAISRFVAAHGFFVLTTGVGRYPRRRINRYGEPNLFLDLQMDLNEDGEAYTAFDPSLPYSLTAGAWFDIGTTRYGKHVNCFHGIPFVDLRDAFEDRLTAAFEMIKGWDVPYLRQFGGKGSLG
ncbi:MAG TPA: hypothetical protein P5572_01350 [Phycisphaerae bacterium]|nr:hypothetical protein [Phycisphaerae bacterium]